ncbi:TlpA family protein disulfide reductase [Brevundimonas sp. LPMIX5]|uniref:TlpA family protein disulfide reductase n=1 Tax=Brevundimonas sp. LPMIX5 TaxID=2305887 RepID=UPI000E6663FF|nr:TlpA disulfide reductase family protein [Brevundimonas sp. LPMIX5]RIJ64930.1 TlpA family protein disulfide reductase [Brevundimonas sp. LPMIX5]
MSGSGRTWAGVATFAVIGVIGMGAALLYVNQKGVGKESAPPAAQMQAQTQASVHALEPQLAAFAKGSLAALQTPASPAAPDYVFKTADGADVRLADFAGKVTVVNLWATWCAPCRIEMPTLAALADHYKARDDFAVVAVSMDLDKTADEARDFIAQNAPLDFYIDPKFQLAFEFPGKGAMPQTIVMDRQGRVRAVLTGEADWAGPEARALIDHLLAEG